MARFYFTFGYNHVDKHDVSLGNCFVCIDALTEGQARDIMVHTRGIKWAFSYPESMKAECIDKYGCIERSLCSVAIPLDVIKD